MPHMGSLAGRRWRCRRGCFSRPSARDAAGRFPSPARSAAHCWPKLRFLEKPWCAVMGTPFQYEMGEGFLSAEAIANPPPFERARAAVAYTGVARRMVQALKYGDRTDLAPWMAALDAARRRRARRRRGCRRSRAVALAALLFPPLQPVGGAGARRGKPLSGKPFEPMAVRRVKVTRQQVGLGLSERQDNVRAAFKVPPEQDISVRGQAGAGGRRRLYDRAPPLRRSPRR